MMRGPAHGATEDYIKVFCLGEYGAIEEGKAVYSTYADNKHLATLATMLCGPALRAGLVQVVRSRAGWRLCRSADVEVLHHDGGVDYQQRRFFAVGTEKGRWIAPRPFKIRSSFWWD